MPQRGCQRREPIDYGRRSALQPGLCACTIMSLKNENKNMKKLILSLAVIAATLSASAQKKESGSPVKFSIGVEAAAPLGDLADFTSLGIGGSAQVDYNVDPTLAITLNAGYIKFLQKDNK